MNVYRKSRKSPLLAGVAAAALVIGAPPALSPIDSSTSFVATAEAQARVSIGFFFDALAPHGRWVRHHAHGWVWVPVGIGPGWRPYVEGRWVYTDRHGWFWVSYEPFGHIVYRYGRWGYHPAYGWFWVPGHIWAPAWVTWRVGGGYVGWAPLAPERRGYAWYYPRRHRVPVAESWVFVESGFVHAPDLRQHVVPIRRIPEVIVVADQRINIDIEQNVIINRPITRQRFAEFGVDMPTVDLTFVQDPVQVDVDVDVDVDVTQIAAFHAEIDPVAPTEQPPEAAEAPEEIEQPAVLDEVLDEVPAEAEAPSVAQIDEEQIEAELEDEAPPDEAAEAPAVPAEVPDEPEVPEDPDVEPEPEPDVPEPDVPEEPEVEPEPQPAPEPEPEPEPAPEPEPEPDVPEEPEVEPDPQPQPEPAPDVPEEPTPPADTPDAPPEEEEELLPRG